MRGRQPMAFKPTPYEHSILNRSRLDPFGLPILDLPEAQTRRWGDAVRSAGADSRMRSRRMSDALSPRQEFVDARPGYLRRNDHGSAASGPRGPYGIGPAID